MLYAKHLLHARHAASLHQGTPLELPLTNLAGYISRMLETTKLLFVHTEALNQRRDGEVTLGLRALGEYTFMDFEGAQSVFIPGKPLTGLAFQAGIAWAAGDAVAAYVLPADFASEFSAGDVRWSTLELAIPRAIKVFEHANRITLGFLFIPIRLKNRWTVQARIRSPVEDS
ncbi:hypothetical protein LTR17_003983 [Elasticomyces elasticus]|nr:hypothetical protein LTR17_003983 [Elasticomyces elasticus]